MSFSGDGNGLQNADDVLLNNSSSGDILKYDTVSQKWNNDSGSQANDSQLRDRATHTGTQAIATVSDLQPSLDSKANQALTDDLAFTNKRYSSDIGTTFTAGTVEGAFGQIEKRVGGGWYSVREFGAVGDGVADDTVAIQAALDGAVGTLYFPPGSYMVSGSGTSILTLTRNLDIIGCSGRHAYIRATAGSEATSLLRVSFTENWGFGQVRNWRFENMSMEFRDVNTYGLHALMIDGGFGIFSSKIENCWLNGRGDNGGNGIHIVDNLFYYSRIVGCSVDSIYMDTQDANTIEKCLLVGGPLPGVTFNLDNGVRNNTVRECCFIKISEAIHIIDGSNIRILNNQCEQAAMSTSDQSTMVWLQGATRLCVNTVISENNFGGGTNLDRLLYIDNAQMTVIEKNHLIAVGKSPSFDGYEIELTANSDRTIIRSDNYTKGSSLNPRADVQSPNIIDDGTLTSITD